MEDRQTPTGRRGSMLPHARDPFALYKVLKQGDDAHSQGAVFVVECLEDGDTYALRMIECNDESEASQTVDEAVESLLPLRHAGVARLKEIFVNFDREAESWYTCSVQPYNEMGSLEFVLEQRRSKEEALPEAIFKKWMGQAVEALQYMHEQGAVHRNVRPSSCYVSEGMNAVLGDPASSLMVHDLASRARSSAEYLSWQAPEIGPDSKVTAKGDVYALGCVFLDLALAGTDSALQASKTRNLARSSPDGLTDAIRRIRVSGHYAKDLATTLTLMLQHDAAARSTSEDLLSDPYIRSCLKLAKSEILAREAKRASLAVQIKPTTTKRLPDDAAGLLAFVQAQIKRVGVVVGCFEQLCRLAMSEEKFELDDEARQGLREAMARWDENVYAQISGMNLLRAALPKLSPAHAAAVRAEFVDTVLAGLKTHNHSQSFVQVAAELITTMCDGSAVCARTFGAAGTVELLLAVWRTDEMAAPGVIGSCVNALCSLAHDPANRTVIAAAGCEVDALADLEAHIESKSVVQATAALLWLLTEADGGFAQLIQLNAVAKLAVALVQHSADAATVTVVVSAMTPLLIVEKTAREILKNDEFDVAGILVDALEAHQGSPSTATAVVAALREMCFHELLHERLVAVETIEVLARLQRASTTAGQTELANACGRTINLLLMIPTSDDES